MSEINQTVSVPDDVMNGIGLLLELIGYLDSFRDYGDESDKRLVNEVGKWYAEHKRNP